MSSSILLLILTPLLALIGLSSVIPEAHLANAEPQQRTTKQERRDLRHILVRTEAEVDALMRRVEAGESFRTLARRHSLDVTTKMVGGDLGENGPVYEAPFNVAAFAIDKVDGLGKCKTNYGWHLIQLISVKEVEVPVRPGTQPPRPDVDRKPDAPITNPTGIVNSDLELSAEMVPQWAPGEDIFYTLTIRNTTDEPLQVFNPKLWGLGFVMMYQYGREHFGNQKAELVPPYEGAIPGGNLFHTLEPNASLTSKLRLQDYFGAVGDWPICRLLWRGDLFWQRLEQHYATEIAKLDGWEELKRRWRYYSAKEQRFNVLPQYKAGDRWFLMAYVRSQVYFELIDPGIPGVMAKVIESIRNGEWDKLEIDSGVSGKGFGTVAVPTLEGVSLGSVDAARLASRAAPFTLYLRAEPGLEKLAGSLALSIDGSSEANAIPIGRAFLGRTNLGWMADQVSQKGGTVPGTRRLRTQVSLGIVYPYELLPTQVKTLADLPMEKRMTLDPLDPKAGTTTTSGQEPEKQPSGNFAHDLPRVLCTTAQGSFVLELFEDHAPNTVANFLSLVESGFYDGLTFHRKDANPTNRGFIQGGCPKGTGQGDPGYSIKDEINADLKHRRGTVSMAVRWGTANSGGSQFLICLDDQPQYDELLPIFARVVQGIEVVDRLEQGMPMRSLTVQRKRDHQYTVEKIEK